MNTTTTTAETFVLNNFTAVDFLVNGSGRTILLNDVSWDRYEMFLKDFEERAGWRLTYDGGRLEIMPPTPEHEEYSFSFQLFVVAYCDAYDLNFEGRGSTTFTRKFAEKGVEPDECFYIQTAEKITGKKLPTKDFPVPDIAVEIDVTTESLDKFRFTPRSKFPKFGFITAKRFHSTNSKRKTIIKSLTAAHFRS